MKNKIVNIVLAIVLAISIGGNICILKLTADARRETAALGDQIATAENQVAELEGQMTGFAEVQEQVAALQGKLTDFERVQTEMNSLQEQLTESQGMIESLEGTVAEQKSQMADLEAQWAEQERLLQEAQAKANKANTTTPDYKDSTVDANGTGAEDFIPNDDPSRGGSGDNHDPEDVTPGSGGGVTVVPGHMEPAPGFDGNTDWNSGYDPNNPDYLPGMG